MQDKKPSILIVDDVLPNIKLLSAMLSHGNYKIYEALNGQDAIEMARRHRPTLVILDVMMPDMDGYAVCERLKRSRDTKDIAVIFISAKNTTEDKIRGLELGAVDYIVKPFQKSEVIARVGTHMALQVARRRLNDSEQRHAALVENLQDGIFLWTPEKGVFFANPTLLKMAGLDVNEEHGRLPSLKEIVHPDEFQSFESELLLALSGKGGRARESQIRMLFPHAKDPLHTACIPARISVSDSPAVMVTVRDMTERINLERQLSRIQKTEAISLLTAGIAHDFSNLLSLINGYADVLIQEAGPESPLQDRLKCILSAGRSAVSLTKGLLSFGKKRDMDLELLDLVPEIRRLHGFLSKGLPKNVLFRLSLPDEGIGVMADAAMLQQVLMNLCLNSRDAMPSGGELTLSLRKLSLQSLSPCAPKDAAPGDYVAIDVSDTGSGIPDEIKDRIFDPFFTTKAEGKGSGLGLAMVDRIARGHNGWVQFESSEGNGSTFSVFLPLAGSVPARSGRGAAPKSYKHSLKGNLDGILVVDKDETHLAMLQYFLEKEGYQVRSSSCAKSAVQLIERSPESFNLAIIEQETCGDGSKLRKRIAESWPHIKVLMIVSSGGSMPVGAGILIKPFSVKDLLQALDTIS